MNRLDAVAQDIASHRKQYIETHQDIAWYVMEAVQEGAIIDWDTAEVHEKVAEILNIN